VVIGVVTIPVLTLHTRKACSVPLMVNLYAYALASGVAVPVLVVPDLVLDLVLDRAGQGSVLLEFLFCLGTGTGACGREQEHAPAFRNAQGGARPRGVGSVYINPSRKILQKIFKKNSTQKS